MQRRELLESIKGTYAYVPHYYSPSSFPCINNTHARQRKPFRKTEPAESCPFVTQRNMGPNGTVGHSAGSWKLSQSYPALEQKIVKLDVRVTQPKLISHAERQGVFF